LVVFGIVVPLAVFGVIGDSVGDGHRFSWDAGIAKALDARGPRTPLGGDAVASVAAYAAVGVGALVALLLVRKRRVRQAFFWALAIGGSLALDPVLKSVFKRPSPDGSAGYSFPSGTAMLTVAAATAVVLLSRRRRLRLAAGGAAVVGAYAAVIVHARWHYPSDVLAGWALGLAWVSSLWLVVAAPVLGRHLSPADVRRGERGAAPVNSRRHSSR
jgi:undecaprenyl-diphosphatase